MMLLLPKFRDLPKNSTLSEKDYLILDLKNLLRKKVRNAKKSTVEKARANIAAHKVKTHLPTGNEHEIHETTVANFAVNVYEPLDAEPYV